MQYNTLFKNTLMTLCVSSALMLAGCATSDLKELVSNGNATSITQKKLNPISPTKVVIYDTAPKHYKLIGRLSADNYSMIGMEHSQESIMSELKKLAAGLGANGVIRVHQGLTQTTAEAVLVK